MTPTVPREFAQTGGSASCEASLDAFRIGRYGEAPWSKVVTGFSMVSTVSLDTVGCHGGAEPGMRREPSRRSPHT